jgi:GH18 family chitinase
MYHAMQEVWIAYDNKDSFAANGAFIKEKGLRGFAMWEAGGGRGGCSARLDPQVIGYQQGTDVFRDFRVISPSVALRIVYQESLRLVLR